MASPDVDYVVIGEGEDTFAELLEVLSAGGPASQVRGIAFLDDAGEAHLTPARPPPDLNSLIELDYSLLPYEDYIERSTFFNFESAVILPVETSRGCLFRCSFCSEPAMARQWRCMDVNILLRELVRIRREYGVRAIAFVDDLFFGRHDRSVKIVDQMIELDLGLEWYANARADYVVKHGRSFFQRVARAGCRSLTLGAEGGTNEVLKRVRKGPVSIDVLLEANQILRDVGIAPHFSSILGYPLEQRREVMSTIGMACSLLRENETAKVSLNKLIPTPGSPILNECARAGFAVPSTLDEWASVFYTDAGAWMMDESAEALRYLASMCELIGMVHTGSATHDALFNLINAISESAGGLESVFSTEKVGGVLDQLLKMNGQHFSRYPWFGDRGRWQER